MTSNLQLQNKCVFETEDFDTKAKQIFDLLDASYNTRQEYKSRIGLFLTFLQSTTFNHNTFLEFKRYLAERSDFAVATKNKYLATARIFLKELNRRGLIPTDITQNIKAFNQSNRHKLEGLNQSEIEALVEKVHNLPTTPKNARLKALFCLLAFQGLRQIEIIRMDVDDLSLVNKKAAIQGKGRDDKEYIHLLPETVKALRIHLKINKVTVGAIFKSVGNRRSKRITTMTIKRELGALFDELGIDKTVHGFRHYFITTLLKKFDVRDVRKFSRHKNLETLIVYDDEIDIGEKAIKVAECFEGLNVS